MQFSDMNLSPEETAAVDAMTSFNLIVPSTVARDGKGYARWNEIGTIESASREDQTGNHGEQRIQFTAKIKIVPSGGPNNDNVGKTKYERMLVNFGVIKGKAGAEGSGDAGSEKIMSAMSIKKIKQLAVAAGLDLSAGVTGAILDALFPLENTTASLLLGMRLALSISDVASGNPKYGNNQNVDNFLKIEG